MRILAIRGKNLASLGGDFAVELGAPPLAAAGIFAITGPTGAGKTTLLDAMCLALFDRTPRLSDRGGVRVGLPGEEDALWVASHDVRSLLRKGCSSGAAEVDFLGRDGRVYRARWAVRRARDRFNGQLQAQIMSLQILETGELIGRTKSDVLAAIEARLGLSFEQFRRSALLAQGDFAAFLRAGEKERAELLEQMTGTDLYGQLSIQAHERARLEQRSLDALLQRFGGVALRSPEERAALLAALQLAEQDAEAARKKLLEAEEHAAWGRQLALLREREQDASLARRQALLALETVAPERALLDRMELLSPSLPLLAARDRLAQEHLEATREREQLASRCEAAREAAAGSSQGRAQARAALQEAREALAVAEPTLRRAAALDGEVLAARRSYEQAEAEVAAAQEALLQASRSVASLEREVQQQQLRLQATRRALDEAAPVAPVAAEWPRWHALLRAFFVAAKELGAQDLPLRKATLAAAAERARKLLDGRAAAEQRAARAEILAREAEERAATFDPERIRQRREWLLARQHRITSMLRLSGEARSWAQDHLAAVEAEESARHERELWVKKALIAARNREQLDASLQEAQRALEQATAALDLAGRRALLVGGEPCPLCGAEEHPWSREAPALDALVQGQRERVDYLRLARQNADREEINARGRIQDLGGRIEQEIARAQRAQASLEEVRLVWGQLRVEVALDAIAEDPAAEGAEPGVKEAERAVEAALTEVRAEEQGMDDAGRVARRARRDLDAARTSFDLARREEEEARAAVQESTAELQRAEERAERRRAEQESILRELAPAFLAWPGWREELLVDVGAFGKRCAEEVRRFQEQQTALQQAEQALQSAAAELQIGQARAAERDALRSGREATRATRAGALLDLQRRREACFPGKSVDLARDTLLKSIEKAEHQERQAAELHDTQEQSLAAALGALDGACKTLARIEAEQADAMIALASALAVHQADEDELRSVGPQVPSLQQRRHALDRVQEAADNAALIENERRERRQEHEGAKPPGVDVLSPEDASRALAAAEERVSTARVRLADDDDQQARARELQEELSKQQQRAALWAEVAALIGSADGKKFRVFAQSLTFDSLLALANVHLDELARRYQLMRVPGTDLDLQILDREMADEVRPTTSLSGGESFLISLALALALSSLGSRETRVETLFIDEGFGTLDMESLDIALSALDALQGTGRQVGLISHIPGLTERLGAHVRVQPQGAGRSAVEVVGG
jgi:exonuclease SbcC